jgi:hypothetical protein
MPRSLELLTPCALALAISFCLPGRAQDSPAPSLGTVAKQAQKEKEKDKDKEKGKPQAKKVFTNDDLSSGAGPGSSSTSPGPADVMQPAAPGNPAAAASLSPAASPADQLEQMGSLLGQLDSLDRATLAKNVLGGNEANFPGRSEWEQRLFAAKQAFVAKEREIMTKASQLESSSKGLPDTPDPNDPGAKNLNSQLDRLVQETEQSSAAFQALVAEGKELAGQSSSH